MAKAANWVWLAFWCGCLLVMGVGSSELRAQTVGERVSAATESAKAAVEDAGRSARSKVEQLWQTIDQARLQNRTRDEIVGWAIMGLLVGGLLNRAAGMNAVGAFGFGLLGALLGGIVVKLTELDFGLGPVLIRYEDLLLSFVGAVVIVLAAKSFTRKSKAKA